MPRPDPRLSETAARKRGGFVERLDDPGGSRLVSIAPHGGDIERHTAEQAERVAARLGAVCWRCKGWGKNCYRRYHVTSTRIDGGRFPELAKIETRGFEHAVSFHGFRGEGDDTRLVLVGGRAPAAIKRGVRVAIAHALDGEGIRVRVATRRDRWPGLDPQNLVNRLSPNGVQLEQSLAARRGHATAIADAVAAFYEAL